MGEGLKSRLVLFCIFSTIFHIGTLITLNNAENKLAALESQVESLLTIEMIKSRLGDLNKLKDLYDILEEE
jgi:hypothetical protein